MKKIDKEKFNISKLKEMWKDKKGRARIELSAYLIFFLVVVIFARVSSHNINNLEVNGSEEVSFINSIKDNYEYDMSIIINSDTYSYHGKVLGNNSSIEKKNNEEKFFYIINNKYYELDNDGNYLLTTEEEAYPYINYNYLDINNIKNFINNSIKEDNTYKIKVSDIIPNNDSNEVVLIKVDEENDSIEINYTNLFKISDTNITNVFVNITYSNINSIISLEK